MIKSIALLVIAILVVDIVVIVISFMHQTSTLTEARANIVNLEGKVSTMTGDIVVLQNNVSSLQAKLTESEKRATILQTDLTNAKAELVNANIPVNIQQAINLPDVLPPNPGLGYYSSVNPS